MRQLLIKIKDNLMPAAVLMVFTILLLFKLVDLDQIADSFTTMAILLLIFNCVVMMIGAKAMRNRRVKIVITILLIIINMAAVFSNTIYILADRMFFYPNQDEESYQLNSSNGKMSEITISEDDEPDLRGWFYKNAEGKAPLVIYFGGNGECSARRFRWNEDNNIWKNFEDYNFMMVDYPGYGLSEGDPGDKSMYDMAERVYDYALSRSDVDADQIVAFGFSLGTGVATYLSSVREVSGLILMAPYNDGYGLYNSQLNIFHGPLKLLVKNQYKSIEFAKEVTASPLIIASRDDEIIPYKLSLELVDQFMNNPTLYTCIGYRHNDFWDKDDVLHKISSYLQEVKR